jgi:hypothetical protein
MSNVNHHLRCTLPLDLFFQFYHNSRRHVCYSVRSHTHTHTHTRARAQALTRVACGRCTARSRTATRTSRPQSVCFTLARRDTRTHVAALASTLPRCVFCLLLLAPPSHITISRLSTYVVFWFCGAVICRSPTHITICRVLFVTYNVCEVNSALLFPYLQHHLPAHRLCCSVTYRVCEQDFPPQHR